MSACLSGCFSFLESRQLGTLWPRDVVCFNVAGNVAGHMAQAGECDGDRSHEKAKKPKGIFPVYVPSVPGSAVPRHLQVYPLAKSIDFPDMPGASNIQIEPEVGLLVDLVYGPDGKQMSQLVPRKVTAANDMSIRKLTGSVKLSERKNWGRGSKGLSLQTMDVSTFKRGTFVDHLSLVSYLKRDGKIEKYSVSAEIDSYLSFHEELLKFIAEQVNVGTDKGIFENVGKLIEQSGKRPKQAWVMLGAGLYTEWGKMNYLRKGDEILILLYDDAVYQKGVSMDVIRDYFDSLGKKAYPSISALYQSLW